VGAFELRPPLPPSLPPFLFAANVRFFLLLTSSPPSLPPSFPRRDPREYLIVGTCMALEDEEEPREGRLLVFHVARGEGGGGGGGGGEEGGGGGMGGGRDIQLVAEKATKVRTMSFIVFFPFSVCPHSPSLPPSLPPSLSSGGCLLP